jgi:hypothetical protein
LLARELTKPTNEHEISRSLAMPHELLCEMRADERITIVRNRRPIRHGAAPVHQ